MKTDRLLLVWWIALAAIAALHVATFWPGIMTWDAIRQYGQALSGHYDDWHPPAMNWLWRQFGALGPGPAPMLVLQAGLHWLGLGAIGHAFLCERRRWEVLALLIVALMPMWLLLTATILKDSLMTGLLLAAIGLASVSRHRVARGAAAALLIGAATLRFNAVPACLPLLVWLLPYKWRDTPRRMAGAAVVASVPLLLAMPVANALLHAEKSGVELSLVIYDLGGITRFSGVDVLPDAGVADPVAVNAGCYTPVSWDVYAWWGPAPCPIGFANVRPALAARHESGYALWARALARHPLAYAEHRLDHFNRNIRFLARDGEAPLLSTESDPNPWNFAVPDRPLRTAVDWAAAAQLRSPLGWAVIGLALAWAALWLGLPVAGAAGVPLALSALLYGLSFLPLSVASEARYHFWTMLGAGLAAILVARPAFAFRPARTRLIAAFAPLVLVSLLAIGFRIAA